MLNNVGVGAAGLVGPYIAVVGARLMASRAGGVGVGWVGH
jgi:hypothetical protein